MTPAGAPDLSNVDIRRGPERVRGRLVARFHRAAGFMCAMCDTIALLATAYDQYARQADHLVKPVDAPRLAACVARTPSGLADRAPHANVLSNAVDQLRALMGTPPATARLDPVQARVGSVVHRVPANKVVYGEAIDKLMRVITARKSCLIRVSLEDLLSPLDSQRFWQGHRGAVVQARRIETATRDESGRIPLRLRGRSEALGVSRLDVTLFRGI
jgi:DNA-binding LytR/AlgR family response regulator